MINDSLGEPTPMLENLEDRVKVPAIPIIGAPNVGKSSLVQSLLNESQSLAISGVPHTTKDASTWIYDRNERSFALIDTPGLVNLKSPTTSKKSKRDLGVLIRRALENIEGAALVLFVFEHILESDTDSLLIETAQQCTERGTECIAILNKIDLIGNKNLLLPRIDALKQYSWEEIFPVSAKNKDGVELLQSYIKQKLASTPGTHLRTRFVAEPKLQERVVGFVRRNLLMMFGNEVPHKTDIIVRRISKRGKRQTRISLDLVVPRVSYKPILLGTKGDRVRQLVAAISKDVAKVVGANKIEINIVVKSKKK